MLHSHDQPCHPACFPDSSERRALAAWDRAVKAWRRLYGVGSGWEYGVESAYVDSLSALPAGWSSPGSVGVGR